jgi:hypothetical protein
MRNETQDANDRALAALDAAEEAFTAAWQGPEVSIAQIRRSMQLVRAARRHLKGCRCIQRHLARFILYVRRLTRNMSHLSPFDLVKAVRQMDFACALLDLELFKNNVLATFPHQAIVRDHGEIAQRNHRCRRLARSWLTAYGEYIGIINRAEQVLSPEKAWLWAKKNSAAVTGEQLTWSRYVRRVIHARRLENKPEESGEENGNGRSIRRLNEL